MHNAYINISATWAPVKTWGKNQTILHLFFFFLNKMIIHLYKFGSLMEHWVGRNMNYAWLSQYLVIGNCTSNFSSSRRFLIHRKLRQCMSHHSIFKLCIGTRNNTLLFTFPSCQVSSWERPISYSRSPLWRSPYLVKVSNSIYKQMNIGFI